jgi:isopenicillin N synthase-like dioxygenase
MSNSKLDNVPVLDLTGDRAVQVVTLDAALREFGFFYVTNHGLEEHIPKQFAVADDLFNLPLKDKQAMPFDPQLDIGFVGQHGQNLDPNSTSTDTKQQFMQTNNILITQADSLSAKPLIDPSDVFSGSKNYEPNVRNYRKVTKEYAGEAYLLNQQLNGLLFEALASTSGEDAQALSEEFGSQPFIVLKQMKYAGEPSDPDAGKFGAGAHTDWGSFTILATDQTPGLQIYHDDRWLPVPPKPDCLIINSGDQIAQLTNDFYKSALHRVVTTSSKPRFSTAVFTYFDIHARVGPLRQFVRTNGPNPAKYPHRTTLEYFHFKLHESFGVPATVR